MFHLRATLRGVGFGAGLFLLSLGPAAPAAGRPASAPQLDLGTGTLGHGELALGPMHAAIGLTGRGMVGTYLLPWTVPLAVPGSRLRNVFVKVEPLRLDRFSLSLESRYFALALRDIDGDGLNVGARIWPQRLRLAAEWSDQWATTAELTAVFAALEGDGRVDRDMQVYGTALAHTVHAGLLQRYRWSPTLTLWARGRLVLGHSPVAAEGHLVLSESMRARVRARANAAELSSVASGTLGVLWSWRRTNVRVGLGYGHWILPWISLPVGRDMITADVNLYWRFE